jgi:hypothetical protein
MAKNIEALLDGENPSEGLGSRLVLDSVEKSPFFKKAMSRMRDKGERQDFRDVVFHYLNDAYRNNPNVRGVIRSYELSDRLGDVPSGTEDPRKHLQNDVYSEPGRRYPYVNNFVGEGGKNKGVVRRTYRTLKDLTKTNMPALIGLGGVGLADRWYRGKTAKHAVLRAGEALMEGEFGPGFFAGEALLKTVGAVTSPALYLIGGHILYKTIKYFVKKRKAKKELKEVEKMQDLNRDISAQNHVLQRMAVANG